MSRAPLVTNADRDWALEQCPEWCQLGNVSECYGEIVDDGGWLENAQTKSSTAYDKPNWPAFVAEEIEKFEHHYGGEYRPLDEWSSIWRKGWWPKVSASKRFPKSAPKIPQPFFRKGTHEFSLALHFATAQEKRMWIRFGIAQFNPEDPRVKKITEGAAKAAETSRRMAGSAA